MWLTTSQLALEWQNYMIVSCNKHYTRLIYEHTNHCNAMHRITDWHTSLGNAIYFYHIAGLVKFVITESFDPGVWSLEQLYKYTHFIYDFAHPKPLRCQQTSANAYLVNVVAYSHNRADSRIASSQWETSLQSNADSLWFSVNLE